MTVNLKLDQSTIRANHGWCLPGFPMKGISLIQTFHTQRQHCGRTLEDVRLSRLTQCIDIDVGDFGSSDVSVCSHKANGLRGLFSDCLGRIPQRSFADEVLLTTGINEPHILSLWGGGGCPWRFDILTNIVRRHGNSQALITR